MVISKVLSTTVGIMYILLSLVRIYIPWSAQQRLHPTLSMRNFENLPHLACVRVAVESFVELAHPVRVLQMFKALWLGHVVGGIIIVRQFGLNISCWNIAGSDG